VPAADIDERYLDKPYYIIPNGKAGADAFVVIRDAMKRKDNVALARVVLSNREHVIALKPFGKGLLGTTLRYPYELRDEDDYFDEIPNARVSKDMVDLAEHLLDTKAAKFDPDKFKDKYEVALRALVKRKASGKTIEVPEAKEEDSNVIDLMDALKQSLGHKRSAKTTKRVARPTCRVSNWLGERPGDVRCSRDCTLQGCSNRELEVVRKLKTYVTSLGSFEQAIAQRSMKAAKEALGRRQ
jgi:DNA end-binding protein Ku